MVKKAVLIQPPIEDFYLTKIRTYPLNLCYLAAFLESKGINVEIVDMLSDEKCIIPFPQEFNSLKKHYLPWDKSPYSLFKHYQRFGYSKEKVEKVVKSLKGDMFLIPSNFTAYFNMSLEVAKAVKKFHKNAILITGGYHASAVPDNVLKTNLFDYVVVGEGESGLEKILSGTNEQIIFAKEYKGFQNAIPARHLLNHDRYKINNKLYTTVTVGRGCPMKCAFCTIHSVYKNKYRKRDVHLVVDEIVNCNKQYKIEHFDFEDDNLGGAFFEKLLDNLLKADLKNCSFSAMNGIPYLTLTKSILEKMKKLGFTHLDISLATVNGIMNRKTDFAKFEKVIYFANKLSLPVNTYFILGLPETTFEDNLEIIKYLSKFNVQIGPSVYYTVPGIPYYKDTIPDTLCRSTAVYQFDNSKITKEEVILLFRLCRAINFLKKKSKTEFEKLVEEKTKELGLIHIKKEKQNYKFLKVDSFNRLNRINRVLR